MGSSSKVVTLIHFNDVYNIEARDQEPVGGAARFTTAVKMRENLRPLVLFSGDAFNPSLMSTVTKGKQMVPCLNAMNIGCAVYGNHDFDFGVDTLVKMAKNCNFPWLMANVIDNVTEQPLAEGIPTVIIEWQGVKFGLIGLVEEEWIATLATIDPDEITFLDFVDEGRRLANELKEQGADYIIALTHMRWPNDERLAMEVDEIDLILGGHDHDYNKKLINGKWVLKSGTDFRQMSVLTLTFGGSEVKVDIEEVLIDSKVSPDEEVAKVVDEYSKIMGEKMETVLGNLEVDLDGRFASIRTSETNLGNFICDIMLEATEADFALLNSGTLRSDMIHPKGPFKMRDLFAIIPMVDPVVVVKISGADAIKALENSVSQYPKLEGRFAQVAGISYAFDPDKPPGQRVDPRYVKIQGCFVNLDAYYRLAVKSYLSEGRDGYDVLKGCEVLVTEEDGPRLATIVQNHFRSVRALKGEKKPKMHSHHRQSVVSLCRRRSIVRQMSIQLDDYEPTPDLISPVSSESLGSAVSDGSLPQPLPPLRSRAPRLRSQSVMIRRESVHNLEEDVLSSCLAPKLDGRIKCITPEKLKELEEASSPSNIMFSVIQE